MATHVEIETKYDVAPDAPDDSLPDLVGVGGVHAVVERPVMTLTATYLDTSDLRLLAHSSTFRRREGGTDDGWHLKLRLTGQERLEVARPLGRGDTPPKALTELVAAIVRSAPLEPVATLVTQRTVRDLVDGSGNVLAEMADDQVTGTSHARGDEQRWRELEVELVAGDHAVLEAVDAALRAAGVQRAGRQSKVAHVLGSPANGEEHRLRRKSAVVDVLRAAVRERTTELVQGDPLLRLDRAGAGDVQRRTGLSLLAALALLDQEGTDDRRVRTAAAELDWFRTCVERLAVHDAAASLVDGLLAEQPRELLMGPVRRRADREGAAARRKAVADVREALGSPRYLAMVDKLEAVGSAPDEPAQGARAGKALPAAARTAARQAERRLVRLRRSPTLSEQDTARAAAVRAVNRALVADRLAGQVGQAGPRVPRALLEDAAERLWQLQVARHAQGVLREMGVQAQLAGENAFTFGRLHGLVDRSAARLVKRLGRIRKRLRSVRRRQ